MIYVLENGNRPIGVFSSIYLITVTLTKKHSLKYVSYVIKDKTHKVSANNRMDLLKELRGAKLEMGESVKVKVGKHTYLLRRFQHNQLTV